MEKHLTLVGIFNIVYRSFFLIGALVLALLGAWVSNLIESLIWEGLLRPHDVPVEVITVVPIVLVAVAGLIGVISTAGIIGAVGVLQRKSWGRILLLVVSFFNLLHIPIGTALGGYTIWVLMHNDTLGLFSPPPAGPTAAGSVST